MARQLLSMVTTEQATLLISVKPHRSNLLVREYSQIVEVWATSELSVVESAKATTKPPLIHWREMTRKARNALSKTSWGDAVCPINKSNFKKKVKEAYDTVYG